jgi:hypothetical protein
MRSASDRIWSTIANNHQSQHSNRVDDQTGDPPVSETKQPCQHQSSEKTDTNHATRGSSSERQYRFQKGRTDLTTGFAQMVNDRVHHGWSCYLVTFMFDQLPGSPTAVIDQMKDRVQRVYSRLVTRVNRKPRKAATDDLPVLIGLADLPVYKRDRSAAPRVRCNDGIHFHALVLLPPSSRLKGSLVDHFRQNESVYVGVGTSVQRIHAEPVTVDHERVVDYAFKTVRRRRLSYEEAVLILPRSRSELATA